MSTVKTLTQVSAGGVVFRKHQGRTEIAIIRVGDPPRWQLPKGIVERGEAPETAALREVREEAGIEADLVGPVDAVEYWYYSTERGRRVRYHKFVHFYLLAYQTGDVSEHDHEVHEARWVTVDEALKMLTFDNEKQIVERARELIEEAEDGDSYA
jgi:8-oxo-dGTP pyrophosphatase MutT (NUDIX family)